MTAVQDRLPAPADPVGEQGPKPVKVRTWRILNTLGSVAFVVILWSVSFPGFHPLMMLMFPFVGLLGIVWLLEILTLRKRKVPARSLLFGPVLGVALVLLMAVQAPLQIRFALSKGSFERVVADLEPAGSFEEWARIKGAPDRIGSYQITSVSQVGEAVIFYESTGAFFDDAGFAYLPDGPSDDFSDGSFERPYFVHLSGDWYSWTASW